MILLNMFFTFFKVGLFTIGGGLVAIPIMQDYVYEYGWVTPKTFVDMIAISQSTPGPIGINLATYVGLSQYGLIGSITATLGMVLPSFIIISLISKFLKGFKENKYVMTVLKNIRPAAVGGIIAAAYFIATVSVLHLDNYTVSGNLSDLIDLKSMVMFICFFVAMFKFKIHPIIYILMGGGVGILLF